MIYLKKSLLSPPLQKEGFLKKCLLGGLKLMIYLPLGEFNLMIYHPSRSAEIVFFFFSKKG